MKNTRTNRPKRALFLSLLLALSCQFLSFNALAVTFSLCQKLNKYGYCSIDGSTAKREPYTHLIHCGSSYLTIRAKDKATLNSYLRNNKNMVVRYHRDRLFIDGSCF